MKKRLNLFALFLGLMALTCAAALAEDEPTYGFKNLSVNSQYSQIELTPLTEDDVPVTVSEGNYPGAVKMKIVYSGAQKDSEYALFVLTDNKAPTADNIAYIDQQTAKDETVTFTAYPKKLAASATGADYYVYISSNVDASSGAGITGYTQTPVATFSSYAAASVTPGDVDEDGDVTAIDARITLQMSSGIIEEKDQTDKQKAAADVDKDGDVTAIDARMILQFSSGILTTFD